MGGADAIVVPPTKVVTAGGKVGLGGCATTLTTAYLPNKFTFPHNKQSRLLNEGVPGIATHAVVVVVVVLPTLPPTPFPATAVSLTIERDADVATRVQS